MKIGIDFGGVLLQATRGEGANQNPTLEEYLQIPAVEGASETVAQLVQKFGVENIHIVSNCEPEFKDMKRQWLSHPREEGQSFLDQSGLTIDNLHFCESREAKTSVARKLGLNAFIDDRLEVLSHMSEDDCRLFLFQSYPEEVQDFLQFLERVEQVEDWEEVAEELLEA